MVLNSKINNVINLSKNSPVLVIGLPASMFGKSTIIEGDISSKNLGIVNTSSGLKTPSWFDEIVKGKGSHQIIINNVDSVNFESQEVYLKDIGTAGNPVTNWKKLLIRTLEIEDEAWGINSLTGKAVILQG